MAKVLIVEDDDVIAQAMCRHLEAAGHEPRVIAKGEQGLAALRYDAPDVCVLDLMLPQRDGWSVIEAARADGFVRRLREKVAAPAPRHTFIQTRYGVGYRLEAVPKA